MKKQYPEDYKGPRAGVSSNEEWQSVTEYQAFKHLRFEDWSYADFDCWLGARDEWHYNRGYQNSLNAFKECYKILDVTSDKTNL